MADFSKIDKKECIEKHLPDGTKLNSSNTLVLQSVVNEIKEHGRSSMNKEICGVLVGSLCWDKAPYLLIDARIEGKFADQQSGSVTFTSETWNYIHSELAEKYPDKKIVGWYHTHPGFGIFLSNMDFFIHENFFGIKWQPAYVFDPQAETEGFFFWHEQNLEQEAVLIIPDEEPRTKKPSINVGEKISVTLAEEEEKKENKARLSHVVFVVIFVILSIVCGLTIFILYKHNTDLANKQIELQRQVEKFRRESIQQQQEDRVDRDSKGRAHRQKIIEHEKLIEGQRVIIIRLQEELDSLKKTQTGNLEAVQGLQRNLEKEQREQEGLIRKLAELQEQSQQTSALIHEGKQPVVTPPPPRSVPPKIQIPDKEAAQTKAWYEYCYPWNWF